MISLHKTGGSVASPNPHHSCREPPLFFVMMRLNIKFTLLLLSFTSLLIIIVLWSVCSRDTKNPQSWHVNRASDLQGGEEIDCDINGEYIIGCRKEGDEVYLPFSFLHKYFEVYGKLASYDGLERFEWSHSYSKVYHPKGKYDPRGVFMYFENYNVEVRERVKCVSATEGVPISTQWESQGYYYPTQIAQFGLSHYSKNLTEPEPRRKTIENGDQEMAKWSVPRTGHLDRVFDKAAQSAVLAFRTSEYYMDGIKLKMEHVLDFIMSLDVLLSSNSSLTVILQNRETRDLYNLHYITSDLYITAQDNNIYHGIGSGAPPKWHRLTRDLIVDLQKGLSFLDRGKSKHKMPRSKLKIVNIVLRGSGLLDNLTLSSSEHIRQFYDAAEWFVRHQDPETGGWAIPVKRKLASGFHDLEAGWYSAMGQGHAVSVLARAYHHSGGRQRFLDAALKGLRPFRVASGNGGVLSTFLDKYHWYEEYPTKPASFVLNGFIYALLGLYDLMTIAPAGHTDEAEFLYSEGMASLREMLPFYDMGSGTCYDLRHVTLGIAPNLARWDYHATHINQLLLLSTIENEPLFAQTADRWIGYMNGKRAAHN